MNVFISYGRKDAESFAKHLASDLEPLGFSVWRDLDRIKAPSLWDESIQDGIDACQAVIAVLSPHAVRRKAVAGSDSDSVSLDEIAYAKYGPAPKPVVPVMALPTMLPPLLFRNQWIDFTTAQPGGSAYQQKLAELSDALKVAVQTGRSPDRFEDLQPLEFELYLSAARRNFIGREWLFQRVGDWITDPGESRVLLLTGDPGAGKSAFAAQWVLRNPGERLLGFHMCRGLDRATVDSARFLRSLAAMIAGRYPAFEQMLPTLAGQSGPLELTECRADPHGAFVRGILQPLQRVLPPREPAVILIDGLDESLGVEGVTIADLVTENAAYLPSMLRLIATSREIPQVQFLVRGARATRIAADSPENRADVEAFVRAKLRSFPRAEERDAIVASITQMAQGNFLVAELLANDAEVRDWEFRPESAEQAIFDGYVRAFRRRFRGASRDYEPARALLGVIAEAAAPLRLSVLERAFGSLTSLQLKDLSESLAPYVQIRSGRLVAFHQTLVDWLRNAANPYRIDTEAATRILVQLSEDRLATVAAGWSPVTLPPGAMHIPEGSGNDPEDAAFSYFARGEHLLVSKVDESKIAAALLLQWNRSGVNTWPKVGRLPNFLQDYVALIGRNQDAGALRLLISGLWVAVRSLYAEAGLYDEQPPGSGQWYLTDEATNGRAVNAAFHLSAAIGTLLGGVPDLPQSLVRTLGSQDPDLRRICRAAVGYARHFADGFSIAHWGRNISGYFEDAGQSVYSELGPIQESLSTWPE